MVKMHYRKRHENRNLILGIILGVGITIGGLYWYENTPKLIHMAGEISNSTTNAISTSVNNYVSNVVLSGTVNTTDLALQIHDLVNQQRKYYGVSELQWNDKLAKLAQAHSNDMMINTYLDHDDLQGNSPQQRIYQSGMCHDGRENIGWERGYYIDQIASVIVNDWMNSFGHRQNVLTSDSTMEGIGVSVNGTDAIVTEDFC